MAMRFFAGTLFALLVAFPWYNEVDTQTQGLFTRLFFLKENFTRATTVMEGHSGGVWFYPLAILVGFFPWSVFAGPTIAHLWRSRTGAFKQSAVTFLVGWVAVQVIAFSMFGTKLPSYVTPCYPALAILTAFGLVEFARGSSKLATHRGWLVAAMVALLLSGVGITVGFWLGSQKYFPDLKWLALIGIVPMVGAVYGWWLLKRFNDMRFTKANVVCAAIVCALLFGVGTKAVSEQRKADVLFKRIAQHPSQVLGVWQCMEPSWVVYGEKPIYELREPGDFYYPSPFEIRETVRSMKSKKPWEFKIRPVAETFLIAFPDSLILTTDEHLESLRSSLPDSYEVLETADRFLKPGQKLILVGRK